MPTICHFEIPADDIDKLREFYAKLFDWKIEKSDLENEYWIIATKKVNGEEGVSGAIEKRQNPQQHITCNFDVPSVEEFAANVEKLGGTVFVPKTAVPGKGYYAYCLDPEGNYFVIWEDDEKSE